MYPHACLQILREPNWAQSRILCRCFQHNITIWRLCPWRNLWKWKRQGELTFQGRRRGWRALGCSGPAHGSAGSHVFLTMFLNKSNFPVSYCTNLTQPKRLTFLWKSPMPFSGDGVLLLGVSLLQVLSANRARKRACVHVCIYVMYACGYIHILKYLNILEIINLHQELQFQPILSRYSLSSTTS